MNRLEMDQALTIIEELIAFQQKALLDLSRKVVPYLTPEDVLQLIDYPELEQNPEVRYEEGMLAGMQAVAAALRAGLDVSQGESS